MTDIRISKARIKDGQLHVELEGMENDVERKTSLKSHDGFHPDLQAAFDALCPSVREILEWPGNLYPELRVTCVSWSHSENTGVEGAVLVCQSPLESCTSPFCFNTPHLPFAQYNEDGNAPLMPDGAQDGLNALRREVQAYIDGKRAQLDLFDIGNLSGPYPVEERIEQLGKAHGMPKSVIDATKREYAR
jgi:hypothetical protein